MKKLEYTCRTLLKRHAAAAAAIAMTVSLSSSQRTTGDYGSQVGRASPGLHFLACFRLSLKLRSCFQKTGSDVAIMDDFGYLGNFAENAMVSVDLSMRRLFGHGENHSS